MLEFNYIIEYCNDIFKDISYTYNCIQNAFNEELKMICFDKERKNHKIDEVNKNIKSTY